MNHNIEHEAGRFYIPSADGADALAELLYDLNKDGVMTATRTFVSDELRGQGIAGKLFDAFIAYARTHGHKVVGACSYVEKKLAENPDDFADVRPSS